VLGLRLRPAPLARRWSGRPGARNWLPYSPLHGFRRDARIADARYGGQVAVVEQRVVDRITVRAGRPVGLATHTPNDQPAPHIPADLVVLAAGAAENLRLVLQLLPERRHRDVARLTDHLRQGFLARLPVGRLPALSSRWCLGVHRGGTSNVFVEIEPAPGSECTVLADVWAIGEQEPAAEPNTRLVRCPDRDVLELEPVVSRADMQLVAAQRALLGTLAAALTGSPVSEWDLDFGDFRTLPRSYPEAWSKVLVAPPNVPVPYTCPLGSVDHEGAALPLGGRLLDETGALRDMPDVYVTGPVTFPRLGAANPSLTTIALSRRTGECVAAAAGQ
jgi:hypothetical protein